MRCARAVLFRSFVVGVFAAWPPAWGADSRQATDIAAPADLPGSLKGPAGTYVMLCHIPPGHPEDAETIYVEQGEVAKHLAHGDYLGECRPACEAVPSPLPPTGQTWCTDGNGTHISCTATGQDAEFQKGVTVWPRFSNNGDGSVRDNMTGLVWLKNADCFGPQKWTNALKLSNRLANGDCGLTDNSVAGDWRLPNIRELMSLVDYQEFFPALPAGHPFSAEEFGDYWTSTSATYAPSYALEVWMVIGHPFTADKSDETHMHVWPVRDAHDQPCYRSEE